MESYKAYFHSKYRIKNKKIKFSPQKKLPRSSRLICLKKIFFLSTPFNMFLLALALYLHPEFSSIPAPTSPNIPDVEISPVSDENASLAVIENEEESNNYVHLSDIGDLINENGQELDGITLNPYTETTESAHFQDTHTEFRSYTVNRGDTFWSIARQFRITVDSLITANDIKPTAVLREKSILKIPPMSGIYYRVQKYDSLDQISHTYKISSEEIKKFNKIEDYLPIGKVLFLNGAKMTELDRKLFFGKMFKSPLSGQITSRYGMRRHPILNRRLFHTGIDIAAAEDTDVRASADGTINYSEKKGTYGNLVIIRHHNGFETYYAHLNKIKVGNGKKIKQGQIIGTVGSTGRSTGPHLHYEIRQNGKYLNPSRFIGKW